MLVEVKLPPGMFRDGTQYQARGRWYGGSLVRFYEGTLRPMGGWVAHSASTVTGAARALLPWRDNSLNVWIAVGTHNHLYVYNQAGTLYDITPVGLAAGRADATVGGGFGSGPFGAGAFGVPTTDTTQIQEATVWTLDTFGQYLIGANADDGKIYEWQLNTASVAAALGAGAPTSNRGVVVTPERFIFALGAGGNPRLVQWGDQGSDSVWTPSATVQAGSYQIQSAGKLMCGKRIRGGTLLFTDTDVHLATYLGPPLVYGFQQVGAGCGIVSQAAAAVCGDMIAWMGPNGFWTYNGAVQPLPSEVGDYVFSNINNQQISKAFALHNPTYGEVDWFYPSAASNEIDSYVRWNYRENHWTLGALARTCGAERGALNIPLMVDASGTLWEHETGWVYTGASSPYVESGPLELNPQGGVIATPWSFGIGVGDAVMHILRMLPDTLTTGDVTVNFYGKFYPEDGDTTYGPYTLRNNVSLRMTGRQFRMRATGAMTQDWRIGAFRLDVSPGGRR